MMHDFSSNSLLVNGDNLLNIFVSFIRIIDLKYIFVYLSIYWHILTKLKIHNDIIKDWRYNIYIYVLSMLFSKYIRNMKRRKNIMEMIEEWIDRFTGN